MAQEQADQGQKFEQMAQFVEQLPPEVQQQLQQMPPDQQEQMIMQLMKQSVNNSMKGLV